MFVTGYSHHIGEAVQQQLSELTNGAVSSTNGLGTASGPSSGSGGSANGDENGYVPQGYDADQDYHSLADNGTQPAYVENSPEFYSPPLMDKAFQQNTFITKSFGRSESSFNIFMFLFKMISTFASYNHSL